MSIDNRRDKVGILTCFFNNFGACLQAYALQKTIEKIGFNSEIIRFTEPYGYGDTNISLRGVVRKIKSSKLIFRLRRAVDKKYAEKNKLYGYRLYAFQKFREKRLTLTETEYPTYESLVRGDFNYSAYVCGSDQIWNPSFYHKCNPAYYLSFVPDGVRKIAYAPSIGMSHIPEKDQSDFIKYVGRLDRISCREAVGCELIQQFTGRRAEYVVDPTLLLTRADWERIVPKTHMRKPYIFCYLFGRKAYYSRLIDRAASHFDCKVIYIPVFEEDADNPYRKLTECGPDDFVNLIKHAEYIITDSFHAVVFSIIFQKNFSVFLRDAKQNPESMNSRLESILSKFELTDRIVCEDAIDDVPFAPVANYTNVFAALDEWRKDSFRFLEEALTHD